MPRRRTQRPSVANGCSSRWPCPSLSSRWSIAATARIVRAAMPDGYVAHGKPVRVLLPQGAHYRGTSDFVERYGASVWTPPCAVWRRFPNPATTDALPRGVEAIELDGESHQVVFFIREHATLVSG